MRPELAPPARDDGQPSTRLRRTRSPIETALASLAVHDPEALMREAQQHAGRDALTGAWQRTPGLHELGRAVDRAHRTLEPLVVVFADVDRLKSINDTSGHAAGDHALASTGAALLGALRSYDLVLRYGGDEFICALPHAGTAQAESRMRHVAALLHVDAPGTQLSSGFALLRPHQSAAEVVAAADQDMYARRRLARATAQARQPT